MSKRDADRTIVLRRPRLDEAQQGKTHASLIVLQGVEIGRDYRLRRDGMIVGRSPEANIRLRDDMASREHARVEVVVDRATRTAAYSLVDLGSTNGTFVNSQAIDRVELNDGDKIQIGDTVMKFVLLDEIEVSFHAEVRERINYDQLTGLLTKESLYLALESELERCRRYDLPLSVLMMDLDHFKSVNDGNGHLMGSHVLAEVGRLILSAIRIADVSGRYGGEEFIAYLSETRAAGARLAAERIRTAIASHPFTHGGVTIGVTISIGIAEAPVHGTGLQALVGAADRALYRAKESGRNRVILASDEEIS